MRAIALWTGFTSTNYTYSCMDHAPLHEMLNFTLYLCYYMPAYMATDKYSCQRRVQAF